MTMSHEEAHDMQLDAHKSAVAKAYGLAAAGYNKPALKFFAQAISYKKDTRLSRRNWANHNIPFR
jgi:hypothetical protein